MPGEPRTYEEMFGPEEIAAGLDRQRQPSFTAENAAPTSAAEWRSARKKGFTVTLPSGHVAHVRRTFDLLNKLHGGDIPNPLASIVQAQIEGGGVQAGINIAEMGEQAQRQMLDLFDDTIIAMMITPMVMRRPEGSDMSWEPPQGYISTEDMDLEDKVFLFALAQGGTADVATFREQSQDLMESVLDGQGASGTA